MLSLYVHVAITRISPSSCKRLDTFLFIVNIHLGLNAVNALVNAANTPIGCAVLGNHQ
jgi:hypothetical protein